MGRGTLRLIILALLLLGGTLAAEGDTFKFKSVVTPAKWTRTIGGRLVIPRGKGPFPVVVFLHPCAGITPAVRRSLTAHARYLVRYGFAVLELDSFGPRGLGGGKACGSLLGKITTLLVVSDAFNAKAALGRSRRIDSNNIFVAGQSLGASAALRAATKSLSLHDGAFRAVVAWYPNCQEIAYADALKSPLLVLAGGKDDWTPPRICQFAKKDGRMTGAEFEVIVYPNARHAFDQPRRRYRYKGHTLGYDGAATAAGRKAMVAFFKKHLKGR